MKIIRLNKLTYVPGSHEDEKNPQVWKKVLLTYKDLISGRVQMINWAKLPVGKTFRAHYHEDLQEIFIILTGKAKITIGTETAILTKGDTIVIPPKQIHQMTNVGKTTIEYIVIGITKEGKGKTRII